MRFSLAALSLLLINGVIAVRILPARESGRGQPIAWCYVRDGPLEVVRKAVGRKTNSVSLGHGALVPVLKTESKNGRVQALLRITDLGTLTTIDGWADSSKAEILPVDRLPGDEEVLRQLNMEPPGGRAGSSASVARWLAKQGGSGPALICFVAAFGLPESRLAAFLPVGAKYAVGPELAFPFSEMKPGILSGEMRDLVGDGVECLITHEPFRKGPEILGVNMVIRRLEHGNFATLWTAPLESRNLGSFPQEIQKLLPLEKNAGAPGTVTKAEVEFEPHGKIYTLIWKATVEFFAAGQDIPRDSVTVSKACAWDGSKFEPIQ